MKTVMIILVTLATLVACQGEPDGYCATTGAYPVYNESLGNWECPRYPDDGSGGNVVPVTGGASGATNTGGTGNAVIVGGTGGNVQPSGGTSSGLLCGDNQSLIGTCCGFESGTCLGQGIFDCDNSTGVIVCHPWEFCGNNRDDDCDGSIDALDPMGCILSDVCNGGATGGTGGTGATGGTPSGGTGGTGATGGTPSGGTGGTTGGTGATGGTPSGGTGGTTGGTGGSIPACNVSEPNAFQLEGGARLVSLNGFNNPNLTDSIFYLMLSQADTLTAHYFEGSVTVSALEVGAVAHVYPLSATADSLVTIRCQQLQSDQAACQSPDTTQYLNTVEEMLQCVVDGVTFGFCDGIPQSTFSGPFVVTSDTMWSATGEGVVGVHVLPLCG